jgi:hypothetical protein
MVLHANGRTRMANLLIQHDALFTDCPAEAEPATECWGTWPGKTDHGPSDRGNCYTGQRPTTDGQAEEKPCACDSY